MTPGQIGLAAFAVLGLLSVPVQAATIKVSGDTIEWVNEDALAHTATATNGDWNVSIAPNQHGQVVVKKPGAADYFCKFHPNMKGRVVVMP